MKYSDLPGEILAEIASFVPQPQNFLSVSKKMNEIMKPYSAHSACWYLRGLNTKIHLSTLRANKMIELIMRRLIELYASSLEFVAPTGVFPWGRLSPYVSNWLKEKGCAVPDQSRFYNPILEYDTVQRCYIDDFPRSYAYEFCEDSYCQLDETNGIRYNTFYDLFGFIEVSKEKDEYQPRRFLYVGDPHETVVQKLTNALDAKRNPPALPTKCKITLLKE
jgi:hypothetical protein